MFRTGNHHVSTSILVSLSVSWSVSQSVSQSASQSVSYFTSGYIYVNDCKSHLMYLWKIYSIHTYIQYIHMYIYIYILSYTHTVSWWYHSISILRNQIPEQIWDHKYMDDQINLRSIHHHAITIVGKISYVLVMELIQKNHLPIIMSNNHDLLT